MAHIFLSVRWFYLLKLPCKIAQGDFTPQKAPCFPLHMRYRFCMTEARREDRKVVAVSNLSRNVGELSGIELGKRVESLTRYTGYRVLYYPVMVFVRKLRDFLGGGFGYFLCFTHDCWGNDPI